MQLPTLLLLLVSLLIGACGMKGDLFEPAPPAAPIPAPLPAPAPAPEGSQPADPDEEGRKTIPAAPTPEQSQ